MWASTQLRKSNHQREKLGQQSGLKHCCPQEGSRPAVNMGHASRLHLRARQSQLLSSYPRRPSSYKQSPQGGGVHAQLHRVREGWMCSGLNVQPSVLLPCGGAFVHPRRAFVMSWAVPSPWGPGMAPWLEMKGSS